jgi:general secretion pathway protein A
VTTKPYEHFGLVRPPFEATPDPRIFCPTASHSEALATLEYALYARKSCTIVIGESGIGKTLIARLAAGVASRQRSVMWLHGLGQPADVIEVSLFKRGALCGSAPGSPPEIVSLADWIRRPPEFTEAPLLVIDNADELPEHGWLCILALLSRDFQLPEPVQLAVLGMPRLLRRIAAPDMMRLRRRIFRICCLRPLSQPEAAEYVRYRLTAAGAGSAEIFTPGAVSQIYRLTRGNPGLINQVCDNAMLEAFSLGRTTVSAADVLAAAQALTGTAQMLPSVWRQFAALTTTVGQAAGATDAAVQPGAAEVRVVSEAEIGRSDINLTQRLGRLEERLNRALEAVRQVCAPLEASTDVPRHAETAEPLCIEQEATPAGAAGD